MVRAFDAFHAQPALGGGLQPRRRARVATARCSRRSRCASEIAGRDARLDAVRRGAHRRPSLVDLATSRPSRPDYPDWELTVRHRATSCARSTTPTSSAGRRARDDEALGRHPGAQRGGLDRRDGDGARRGARAARASTTRCRRRRRARPTGPPTSSRGSPRPTRTCAACARPYRNGFGFAVRAGLDAFEGDAVAIMMADGSDDPRRPRRLLPRCSRPATTARSARASCRGGEVGDYPRVKLRHQPARQPRHPAALRPRLQRHDERVQGLPARGHRERPAAALAPLQPHRRDAAEGDRARPLLRDRPDPLAQPHEPASPSCACRRWAAATCSSCSTSSSSTT